jgi:hypothetical protein
MLAAVLARNQVQTFLVVAAEAEQGLGREFLEQAKLMVSLTLVVEVVAGEITPRARVTAPPAS